MIKLRKERSRRTDMLRRIREELENYDIHMPSSIDHTSDETSDFQAHLFLYDVDIIGILDNLARKSDPGLGQEMVAATQEMRDRLESLIKKYGETPDLKFFGDYMDMVERLVERAIRFA